MVQKKTAQKKTTQKQPAKKRASGKPIPKKQPPKAAAKRASARPATGTTPPALFYRLNTLLHTVRLIGSYEDPLCTLLHEIKSQGAAGPALGRDLLFVLDEMPDAAFREELEAVRKALPPSPATVSRRKPSKTLTR